jgi:hypothetical protein
MDMNYEQYYDSAEGSNTPKEVDIILKRVQSTPGSQRVIFDKKENPKYLVLLVRGVNDCINIFWKPIKGTEAINYAFECNNNACNDKKTLDALIKEYKDKHSQSDDYFATNEDNTECLYKSLKDLYKLNRNINHMHEALVDARKQDLYMGEYRSQVSEISRNFELLIERTKNRIDYRFSLNNERSLKAQHKLNILTSIAFPLIIVGTIFGMNLTSGLENGSGFWMLGLIIAGLIVGGALVVFWIDKKGNK